MKLLGKETNAVVGLEQTAEMVMETVTIVTRALKRERRKHRPEGMSMQQFHALRVALRHPGVSLSDLARHLDLTNASASKLIDVLVRRGLVTRDDAPEDRRRIAIVITKAGEQALEDARKATLGRLAELLGELNESDRAAVIRAMEVLRTLLALD